MHRHLQTLTKSLKISTILIKLMFHSILLDICLYKNVGLFLPVLETKTFTLKNCLWITSHRITWKSFKRVFLQILTLALLKELKACFVVQFESVPKTAYIISIRIHFWWLHQTSIALSGKWKEIFKNIPSWVLFHYMPGHVCFQFISRHRPESAPGWGQKLIDQLGRNKQDWERHQFLRTNCNQ